MVLPKKCVVPNPERDVSETSTMDSNLGGGMIHKWEYWLLKLLFNKRMVCRNVKVVRQDPECPRVVFAQGEDHVHHSAFNGQLGVCLTRNDQGE